MALSRIGSFKDLPVIFSRINHPVNTKMVDSHCLRNKFVALGPLKVAKTAGIHVSRANRYPEAPKIPLPGNVCEIFTNETGRFTPERSRDITTPVLLYGSGNSTSHGVKNTWNSINISSGSWGSNSSSNDSHVDSYDCFGAVNLNSSMQTNVPKPFSSTGRSTHLNMPGGQWSENGKYIAEFMQESHYALLKQRGPNRKILKSGPFARAQYCTAAKEARETPAGPTKLSNAQKLKIAVKDYGSTVIVFHVSISLVSLGVCYALVSSGLDIAAVVKMIPGSSERLEGIMTNSSTFLVAYAVHKVFAPMRISITLGATPFIVRYLRRIGILKMPKT